MPYAGIHSASLVIDKGIKETVSRDVWPPNFHEIGYANVFGFFNTREFIRKSPR